MTDTIEVGVMLDTDELQVLEEYRRLRSEGRGSLYVEFADQKVIKFDLKIGGRDRIDRMNEFLTGGRALKG